MSIEAREKKKQIIDGLEETFSKCSIAILTDYRGLATSEMTKLRRKLQDSGNNYQVVKNTLARFAAERLDWEDPTSSFEGPIAIAFGYGDIAKTAKILVDYIREIKENLSIKGGFLGHRRLTAEEVVTISTLPPREILLAKVLGQMKSPISALVGCLTTPMRGFIGVLQARMQQLEGE